MDHVVVPLTRVKVWTSEGIWTEAQNGAAGLYCTTFDRKVDRVGTWKIDSKATAMMGSAILNGKMKRAGRPRSSPVRSGVPAPVRPVATVDEIPTNAIGPKLTETISGNFIFVSAKAQTITFVPTVKGLGFQSINHRQGQDPIMVVRWVADDDSLPCDEVAKWQTLFGLRMRNRSGSRPCCRPTCAARRIWMIAGC